MSTFAKIASRIRHSSLLESSEWLWNCLRKPYHSLLNIKGNGVTVRVNDHISYKIPPLYYHVGLEEYEKCNIEQLADWIVAHPECLILDIGCSIGIMTTVSLFASPKAQVISFDSDLSSLKSTLNMANYASGNRLQIVWGFINEQSDIKRSIDEVISYSFQTLNASNVTGHPSTTRYINIDHGVKNIPTYSLDDLFEGKPASSPVLLKCDIEGAELLALKGSKNFIKAHRPVVLLSVHPEILPVFNASVKSVYDFFRSVDYEVEVIGTDHEEHWWCYPR
ncbi:FkbM family methyltransferase [Mucilaginibacter sp. BT774]|uniref:FkbM family methyltransferase n=1 Tax=Mucilaginibacter sp. BT774 TaxID=3062276 RepID=UPI002676BE55|nr:FkbM family methyltransferase [Mucilaginibacter sp. BT774]MDO3627481.1 FkbM family methyltransferase [Mucilaginibacter sp. BT774]